MRQERPLVHVVTNFVTMNDVANAVLALGARPVMAHALEEVSEITRAARALVLNLGTPSPERVNAMLRAARTAGAARVPIIFDPVGIGASKFRTRAASRILRAARVSIIRGNADEIATLAGSARKQSGVDASDAPFDRVETANRVAKKFKTVVALTGTTDFISDGARVVQIQNGHTWLEKISGAGDMVSALTGAFAAVEEDGWVATAGALVAFGIAAECAGENLRGLGTFRVSLFDALGNLDSQTIVRKAKLIRS